MLVYGVNLTGGIQGIRNSIVKKKNQKRENQLIFFPLNCFNRIQPINEGYKDNVIRSNFNCFVIKLIRVVSRLMM